MASPVNIKIYGLLDNYFQRKCVNLNLILLEKVFKYSSHNSMCPYANCLTGELPYLDNGI